MNRKSIIRLMLGLITLLFAATGPVWAANDPHSKLTTVNADNVDQLIIVMSDDFFSQLAQVKAQYKMSREHHDARSFLVWRLRAFVPSQTQLETYYQTIFDNNKDYLATTDVQPLLPAFKSLTDTTVLLIEAIRDANPEKMKEAQKQIDQAVASYDKVIKAHNLDDKIKRQ